MALLEAPDGGDQGRAPIRAGARDNRRFGTPKILRRYVGSGGQLGTVSTANAKVTGSRQMTSVNAVWKADARWCMGVIGKVLHQDQGEGKREDDEGSSHDELQGVEDARVIPQMRWES